MRKIGRLYRVWTKMGRAQITDNDSAFLNDTLFGYCKDHSVVFTRSRAYQKNDQAWVEQKNGAIVRKLIGYH